MVLQPTPSDDLRGLGKHGFDFYRYNRVSGHVRFDHPADQEVLLFGDGCDRRPFGQQQFFRLQRVHGLRHSRAVFHFPGGVVLHDSCAVVAMQVLPVGTLTFTR